MKNVLILLCICLMFGASAQVRIKDLPRTQCLGDSDFLIVDKAGCTNGRTHVITGADLARSMRMKVREIDVDSIKAAAMVEDATRAADKEATEILVSLVIGICIGVIICITIVKLK